MRASAVLIAFLTVFAVAACSSDNMSPTEPGLADIGSAAAETASRDDAPDSADRPSLEEARSVSTLPASTARAHGGRGNDTAVCHVTGNGSYHLIHVNENAWPAHERHGDFRLGPATLTVDLVGRVFLHTYTIQIDDCDGNFQGDGSESATNVQETIRGTAIDGHLSFRADYMRADNYYYSYDGPLSGGIAEDRSGTMFEISNTLVRH